MGIDWLVSICSAAVGFLVGMTGMGGGSVMTALLILLFGVHPIAAVGTDLLFAAITKSVGTATHAGNKNVDWIAVGRLAIGSVPAALVTLLLLSRAPLKEAAIERAIAIAIGSALVLAAAGLFLRGRLQGFARAHSHAPESHRTRILTILLGVALGIVVPTTSVGAGAFGLAVLSFLYPSAAPVRLVGTDIAHAVPLTLLAGLGHWLIGNVDWSLLASMIIGSVPAIIVGSHTAHWVPERIMLPVLALLLFAIGCGLLIN